MTNAPLYYNMGFSAKSFFLRGIMKLPHIFSPLAGVCIVLAVIIGPMAFGSVEPWAYSVLAVLAFTALASSLLHDLYTGRATAFVFPLSMVGLAAMLLVYLQWIPWPAGWLELIQPESLVMQRVGEEFSGGSRPSYIIPSLYPHATGVSLLKLGSFLALFAAACSYITGRRRMERITIAVVATGFVVSMIGLLQNLGGADEIFWYRSISSGSPFGPFVSRNQFAGYAAIVFFTGLGLLLARGGSLMFWSRSTKSGRRTSTSGSWQNILLGFAVSVTGVSVVWSLSRGGILALALGATAAVAAMAAGGFPAGKRLCLAAVFLLLLGFLTWFGWEPVLSRLQTLGVAVHEPSAVDEARYAMWGDAWRMGLKFPVFGTGAGTFLSAYPSFSTLPFRALARNPHNEYLGVLAEAGFAGLVLLLLGLFFVFLRIFRALRARRSSYALPYLAAGGGAVFSVAIHSIVDFPLRSPGIVATLAVVLAVIHRASLMGGKKMDSGRTRSGKTCGKPAKAATSSLKRTGAGGGPFLKVLLTVLILAGWALACHVALGELSGQIEKNRIARASEQLTPETENVGHFIEASRRAIESYSRRNAALYSRLAEFARLAAGTMEDPLQGLELREKALDLQQAAVRLEPVNAYHRVGLAMDCLYAGRADLGWMHARIATEIVPNDPWVRIELARMFFSAGFQEPGGEMLDEAERLAERRGLSSVQRRIERMREGN